MKYNSKHSNHFVTVEIEMWTSADARKDEGYASSVAIQMFVPREKRLKKARR